MTNSPSTVEHIGSRSRRRRGRLVAVVVGITVLLLAMIGAAGTAEASTGRVVCAPVRLTGEGVQTGPASTTATIFLGRRAIATTAATFAPRPDGTLAGDVVFTPKRFSGGTLVAHVVAAFAPDGKSFTARGPVTGTGNLSRASGHLAFAGPIRPDGSFSEVVTGTLCVDISRW